MVVLLTFWASGVGADPPAPSGAGAIPWLDPGSLARLPGSGGGNGNGNGNGNNGGVGSDKVLNIMAAPYNAVGTGQADDTNAIQQAIWDASTGGVPFGACATTPHKTIYLPVPIACFLHSQPIRTTCPNVEIKGEGSQSGLCQNYVGDALIQEGSGFTGFNVTNGNLNFAPSLVTGTGSSLVSAPGPKAFIDLDRYLDDVKTPSFGGGAYSAAGFNIAFFMKATAGGGSILCSAPSYPGTGNGAFCFTYNGSNQVIGTINTAGGLLTLGTCPAQTLGQTYEIEVDWDKTTYRLWQGTPGGTAASCGTAVSANPMIMGLYEEATLPSCGPTQFWPDGSACQNNAFTGNIDSIRFEYGPVHTAAYTVPTTKWPNRGSGSDILLENFETSLDGTQHAWVQFGDAYFTIYGAYNISAAAGGYLHNFELCSDKGRQDGPFGASQPITGLFSAGANSSRAYGLSCSLGNYVGADFTGDDFYYDVKDLTVSNAQVGAVFGAAWNDSTTTNAKFDLIAGACEVYQGGGGGHHHDKDTRCTDRGAMRYGFINNQTSGVIDNFYLDQKTSSPNFVAEALLNAPSNPTVFNGGLFQGGSTGVYVQNDNGGAGSSFIGSIFASFGAPPAVIQFTGANPTSPTQLINTVNSSGAILLSNRLQWIQQPGIVPEFKYVIAGSTALTLPAVGESKQIIALQASAPLILPAGLAQAGPNYNSQFMKAYVCYSGSRTVIDGVTNSTTTITSATAAFVAGDVGRIVTGSADIPVNDTIASVTNGTTAVLAVAATAGHSAQVFNLNNFIPGWTNGAGNAIHGPLPARTPMGNVCDIYNWDSRDPNNIFMDSSSLNLPG